MRIRSSGYSSGILQVCGDFFTCHFSSSFLYSSSCLNLFFDSCLHCAGQERFGNMTRVYYKEAVGAFVVFDITRLETFDEVKKWKADIDSKVKNNSRPV